jgi:hypothetical protein
MAGWELEVDFDLSQDLYLVHVYHDVLAVDEGIRLLTRSRDARIVVFHLGTWLVFRW